uniref:hypothetical protein n=1 Tax=Bradyrhizobium sp. (strain ORS 278) TaxID=114615 RepID=UPI00030913C2|nr:hypothetical protein [Bradyrhizobium sp. ORS 278]
MESLVERSVRTALRVEPPAGRSVDTTEAEGARGASPPTLPPGVVRPRRRSRHEPRPQGARFDLETIEDLLERWPSPSSGAAEPVAPVPRDEEAMTAEAPRRTPAVHRWLAGRDAAPSARRLADAPQPRLPSEADASLAAASTATSATASSAPTPRDDEVPPVLPASRDRSPQARPYPDRSADAAASVRPAIAGQQIAQETAPLRRPDPPRTHAAVTMSPQRQESSTTARPSQPGTLERAAGLRPTAAPSREPGATRQPPTMPQQPSMPRVEITIGRVEVRAVYAPPAVAERKPSARPMTSLDDYLKQRDKAG